MRSRLGKILTLAWVALSISVPPARGQDPSSQLEPLPCCDREALDELSRPYYQGAPKLDCRFDEHEQPLEFRVSWVYMHRNRPGSSPLFFSPTGTSLADADQFNFGWQSGIDASGLVKLNEDWGLDARYLWIDPFEAAQMFGIPGTANPTSAAPPAVYIGAANTELLYTSKIQSIEWNLRRNYGAYGILAGFRWAQLDERRRNDYNAAFPDLDSFSTRNNLYGAQIGADGVLWKSSGKLRIEGFGKAGIYGAGANATFVNSSSSVIDYAGRGQISFLGELGAFALYPLGEHTTLRAGCQMLWLSGVALASEQASTLTNSASGPVASTANANGDLFFQGVNVGLETRW